MKILELLIVPIGVIIILTVFITLGRTAGLCLVTGLCLGSLMEIMGLNKKRRGK